MAMFLHRRIDWASLGSWLKAAAMERATSRLLDLTLREGMTFVDVGANIGLYTLHGARRVGPTGAVIALEPTPNFFGSCKSGLP